MECITVREYADGKARGPVYIETFAGLEEVTGLRIFSDGPWVVCGKANAGMGISYSCTWEDDLLQHELASIPVEKGETIVKGATEARYKKLLKAAEAALIFMISVEAAEWDDGGPETIPEVEEFRDAVKEARP